MPIKSRIKFSMVVCVAIFAVPFFAHAQSAVQYPNGVTTCERNGSAGLSSSVGSFSPIGGPYVPVVDYAVELNTATLVYKECVLRTIVIQERKAATALIVKDMTQKFNTQRNGGPMFPVSLDRDILARQDAVMNRVLRDGTLGTLNQSDQALVKGAIALNWRADTRSPNNAISCPYQGDINTLRTAQDFSFEGLWAESDPRCQPLFEYYLAQDLAKSYVGLDTQEMAFRLTTSNGVYGVEGVDQYGNKITKEPGIFAQQNETMALQSGFIQLQNANDVGQIVDALFASMADQAMTSSGGGLSGLTQSIGGAPSYLDQVLKNELGGLGGTISSGIMATLQNLLANEQLYNQTVTATGQLVQKAITDLQTAEPRCFAGTTHSQLAIKTNLAPIVTDVAPKIASSTIAIMGLKSIIASMSSPTPPTATQIGQQLNALPLNSQTQTAAEQARLQKLQVDIPQFVQDTIAQWQSVPGAFVGCGSL